MQNVMQNISRILLSLKKFKGLTKYKCNTSSFYAANVHFKNHLFQDSGRTDVNLSD